MSESHESVPIERDGEFYFLTVQAIGTYKIKREPNVGEVKSLLLAIEQGGKFVPLGKLHMRLPDDLKDELAAGSDRVTSEEITGAEVPKSLAPSDWIAEPFSVRIRTKGMKPFNHYPLKSNGKQGLSLITPVFLGMTEGQTSLADLEEEF